MNKGLEKLNELKQSCETHMGTMVYTLQEDKFETIEKELKEKEELREAYDSLVRAFTSLSKDDEKAKKLLSLEIEKNRALATIVQIFDIRVEKNKLGQCFVSSTNNLFAVSQETHDLLKRCCYERSRKKRIDESE